MTTKRDDKSDMGADKTVMAEHPVDPPVDVDQAQIARELAALGENPADDDEYGFAGHAGALEADGDVATVGTLISISQGGADVALDELGARRVWANIDGQLDSLLKVGASPVETSEPAANTAVLRTVLAGFAVAASLVVLPRLGPEPAVDPQERQAQREALKELGSSARSGLGQLRGSTDTARATAFADAYAERLANRAGAEVPE